MTKEIQVSTRQRNVRRMVKWRCPLFAALGLVALTLHQGVGASQKASGTAMPVRTQLPTAEPAFGGTIALDARDSAPAYPPAVRAPKGAPNILLIMTDDEAFGATDAFGGAIPTPNLNALAGSGIRYTQFHTTAMCSPSRAALLTGRNHHAAGVGSLTNYASGYPGYTTQIPNSTATVAQVLRMNGYNTAMFGKHHNVPLWQNSAAGPFDMWPTGLGFEYFYGFVGSDTDQ